MKRILLSALVGFAGIASASQVANPILRYSVKGGGLLPPGVEGRDLVCDIYEATVSYRNGSKTKPVQYPTKYTKALPNAAKTLGTIRAAKAGVLKKEEGPTDGPTTRYVGILTVGAGAPDPVLLAQFGGEMITNSKEKEVAALTELADANCQPEPEILAMIASDDYKEALEEIKKKQGEGYTAVVTGYSVLKIGEKDVFTYAELNRQNVKTGKGKSIGKLVGTVVYKDEKPEIDGVFYEPNPEPAGLRVAP